MNWEQPYFLISSLSSSLINSIREVPEAPDRILIIKQDEIGDMVYTLHVLSAIRTRYTQAEITLLCNKINASWVGELGYADHIIHTIEERSGRYDLWVELRGWYPSLFACVRQFNAYRLDRVTQRLKNKFSGGQLHERLTNWNIVQPLFPELELPEIALNIPESITNEAIELIPDNPEGYIVFHCGAREVTRRWSPEHFAKLADLLYEEYRTPVILVGANNEGELNQEIAGLTKGKIIDLSGKTSILQMAAIIRKARLFIGNESGPLHFAIVQRTPLLALFGPGVKNVFYPYHENQIVIHPESTKDDRATSMERISFYVVVEQAKSLLDG